MKTYIGPLETCPQRETIQTILEREYVKDIDWVFAEYWHNTTYLSAFAFINNLGHLVIVKIRSIMTSHMQYDSVELLSTDPLHYNFKYSGSAIPDDILDAIDMYVNERPYTVYGIRFHDQIRTLSFVDEDGALVVVYRKEPDQYVGVWIYEFSTLQTFIESHP